MTILVVDDDKWQREHYERQLAAAGYEVSLASDPQQAIELVDDIVPDAIVLDMLLHYNTAAVLLHELQSHAELAKIPVVMVTNTADKISLEQLKPYGVCRLLDKASLQPGDIAATIKAVTL